MVQIIKLGKNAVSNKAMKPIEALHFINEAARNSDQILLDIRPSDVNKLKQWDNIMLLNKGDSGDLDTFIGWDNATPLRSYVYLGHWNDGVLE